MYQDTYYVVKRSGTFSDVLLAFGLARLVSALAEQALGPGAVGVRVRDAGPYFAVALDRAIEPSWLERASFQSFAPYIQLRRDEAVVLPPEVEVQVMEDYWEQLRARSNRGHAAQAAADAGSEVALQEVASSELPPAFEVYQWLGERRMQALGSYNELILRWVRAKDLYRLNVEHLLRYFASPAQDPEQAQREWSRQARAQAVDVNAEATLLQLLNPSQGKGQNETKAVRALMGNLKGWWLLEYLKAIGVYECAVPRHVENTKDRKVYVVTPLDISLAVNRSVLERFQRALWTTTAAKMDALAAIEYTRAFLEHCQEHPDFQVQVLGYSPDRIVSGLHTAYYKSLGQASAVMNLAFINLARWVVIRAPDDVPQLMAILDEHRRIVRAIDEDRGGYDALVYYRDFLSGGLFDAFFAFAAAYAHLAVQQLARGRRMPLFTVGTIRRLLMSSDDKRYSTIAESSGIQELAYAIRHATVVPQLRKATSKATSNATKQDTPYEVRYGLSDEIRRALFQKEKLIEVLSRFVESYQRENGRILERGGRNYRRDIRTDAIHDVIRLIDEFGPGPVGNILIALGYSREPREPGGDTPHQGETVSGQ